MAFLADLADLFFSADFTNAQVLGLFFLLGSFTVASLSDLKHMAAQREFVEVWWVFAGVMLVVDLVRSEFAFTPEVLVKWGILGVMCVVSHRRVGPYFRLATGDVAACAAAASLLAPGWVIVFFLLLKAVNFPLAPLLARGKPAYPFMPIVTLATLGIVALAAWSGGYF